jgi:hypothetical protein
MWEIVLLVAFVVSGLLTKKRASLAGPIAVISIIMLLAYEAKHGRLV